MSSANGKKERFKKEIITDRAVSILDFNRRFVERESYKELVTSGFPEKKLVVLSCMDTRLTELLPKAMNLRNGDAKIVKNAGATIMHPFGSITRSILVAVYEFEVEDVFVVGHYGCGMAKLDGQEILKKAVVRGVESKTIETLRHSGIAIDDWLRGFDSESDAVLESVERLRNHPLMPKDVVIHGMLMHPETGKLDHLISK